MRIFNMLESLLFLTLGISCVLLLMLIYHFKQRLTQLEQSNETMFDILNNMVHELSDLKRQKHPITTIPFSNDYVPNNSRIDVELSEDPENSDESEYDSEIETENVSIMSSDSDSLPDLISNQEDTEQVKLVNVNIDETLEDISTLDHHPDDYNAGNTDDDLEDNGNLVDLDVSQIEEIHIDKLNQTNHLEEVDTASQTSVNTTDIHKKMTVVALKSLVIEKGLASDPSKLRKPELIELLESNM